nr:Na(+)-translocating NADH-quinone reductase subunit C [uncultured Desulfobulbus sp.]
MAEESVARPFYTVLVLALVCSALVAGTAVGLRPFQEANRKIDKQKNILRAAGLFNPDEKVVEQFQRLIQTRLVDLTTGRFVDQEQEASENLEEKRTLARDEDPAGLFQLERFTLVYLVRQGGSFSQIILPVRGKGLWSTMYAYVAVDADLNTIRGISFYEHGETPGLGGEIENPSWQAGWKGKHIYGAQNTVALKVVKNGKTGGVSEDHRIDGISGATMTGNGVSAMLRFWFGDNGFGPLLQVLQQQGGLNERSKT